MADMFSAYRKTLLSGRKTLQFSIIYENSPVCQPLFPRLFCQPPGVFCQAGATPPKCRRCLCLPPQDTSIPPPEKFFRKRRRFLPFFRRFSPFLHRGKSGEYFSFFVLSQALGLFALFFHNIYGFCTIEGKNPDISRDLQCGKHLKSMWVYVKIHVI